MAKGWQLEPGRHALAAKGVKTGRKAYITSSVPVGIKGIGINKKLRGNAELLKKYMPNYQIESLEKYPNSINEYWHFQGVPPEKAKMMLKGAIRADPNDTQNNSPTMKEMVEIAEKYRGELGGYVIPLESGRDDARITFTEVILHGSANEMIALNKELQPDEFDKIGNKYRFWWD